MRNVQVTRRGPPFGIRRAPRFLNIPELRRSNILVTFEEFAKITAGAEARFISYILDRHFGTG